MSIRVTAGWATTTVFVGILSFGLGFLLRPAVDGAKRQYGGGAVRCISQGSVCVGMTSDALRLAGDVGGVIAVDCGFTAPGEGAGRSFSVVDLVHQDCPSDRYVISFSNGERLTNAWVDKDRIVRLDDYPGHVLDL